MVIRGWVCCLSMIFSCCNLMPSLPKEGNAEFFQRLIELRPVVEAFEKKYTDIPKFICLKCKEKASYGLVIGTIIGGGLMAAMKGGDLDELEKISGEMIDVLSKKTLDEVGQFMLNAVYVLKIKCQECDAMDWNLTSA